MSEMHYTMSLPGGQTILSALTAQPDRLEFVNISEPGEAKSRTIQRTIRRHARRTATRTSKWRQKPPVSYVFDLVQNQLTTPTMWLEQEVIPREIEEAQQYNRRLAPGITRLNRAPCLPMVIPVQSTPRVIELVTFLFRDAEINYRPYFRSWISVAIRDPWAFYITLSNAAMRLSRLRISQKNDLLLENHEDLDFYTRSVHAVQMRLMEDPSNEGLIGTVIGLACRDVNVGDSSRSKTHLVALKQMFRTRKGSLATMPNDLRRSLLEVDVRGSLAQDQSPLFPPPLDLFPEFLNPSHGDITLGLTVSHRMWQINLPDQEDLQAALLWTAAFTKFVNARLHDLGFWRQDSLAFIMLLVLHTVLSVRRINSRPETESALVFREAIRMALVVYLGLFKDLSAIPGCRGFDAYPGRVKKLMENHDIDWTPFLTWRLWVLVVCGAAQPQESLETAWYVDGIVSTMVLLNLKTWTSVMEALHGLFWIEPLALDRVRNLGEQAEEKFSEANLSRR